MYYRNVEIFPKVTIKRAFFSLVLLFTSLNAVAQDFRLAMTFYKPFADSCMLSIDQDDQGYYIFLQTDSLWGKTYINHQAVTDISDFMKNYQFPLKPLDNPLEIKVKGMYGSDSLNVGFSFGRPSRNSKNHELIKLLLTILYANIDDSAAVAEVENLEYFFDFGLGLKQLSAEPLVFKLYGSVTAREADDFYNFLNAIPIDTTYIDMSNFKSMGTIYYSTLRAVSAQRPHLYWINCNLQAERHLKNAGVNWENIR